MFQKIEEDFKKLSQVIEYRKYYVLALSVVFIIIFATCIDVNDITVNIDLVFIIMCAFYMLCYVILFIITFVNKQTRIKDFTKFSLVKSKFDEFIHRDDIESLNKILVKYGVDTRPKVAELLRHYQSIMYKNIKSNGQFISLLALGISLLAFFFSETLLTSYVFLQLSIEILLLIIMCYFLVSTINKNLFSFFGNEKFYERIESYVFEIFVNYYKK